MNSTYYTSQSKGVSFISCLALECKVEEANPLIALNAWRIVQGIQVEK